MAAPLPALHAVFACARASSGAVGSDACGGLLGVLAAAAAAAAAAVTAQRRGYCRSTGWFQAGPLRPTSGKPASLFLVTRPHVPSCLSSPCLELAAVSSLPASGPPGHIPFLQPGPPGHPLCRPQLAASGSSFPNKLARFREHISAPRSWAPAGASWLSCAKQRLADCQALSCCGCP
jgi:hypothetical protein